eukprot:NODE_44_length_33449_cov_1.575742.p3 type:complete len:417 gc:universal NODE_44_length_33449_cov_1.575742:11224-12474(+)
MSLHPQCRPKGNKYTDNGSSDLGWFTILEESTVFYILSLLSPGCLLNFGQTCKHGYVWSWFDELWKSYCMRENIPIYKSSWRNSYTNGNIKSNLNCTVYNDLIFDIYRYSNADLPFANCDVPVIEDPSLEEFLHFERQQIPCLVKGGCNKWLALKLWTWENFSSLCGDTLFQAEQLDIKMSDFLLYALGSPKDEAPIYLFDKHFIANVPELSQHFEVPEYFIDDLFQHLPERPDFRWIIVGPERSGSTFHKDPNMTSAWNAVIKGKKLWIFCPPNVTPPGIYPSPDGGDVTTPVSLMDWYINYKDQCKCLEVIAEEGDIMYIPSGWWHMVINLEPSIAITQNYVNRFNLLKVLKFLKNKKDQISGISDLDLFDKCMKSLDKIKDCEIQSILRQFKKKKALDNAFVSQHQFKFQFEQ